MRDPARRRPCVCIMSGGFHTDYSRSLTESVSAMLEKEGLDVCLFQGLDAARYLELENYVDEDFDRHYYSKYEYCKFLSPDLIILSFGTISAIPDSMPLEEFLQHLPQIPVVLLEEEANLPGVAHITVDNTSGMKECVEHLILDHGYQKILFVSGPRGIPDAEQRLKAYLDTMHLYGLPVTEDMIAYGNYTDHVDYLIEALLARHPDPDAIVCANDDMAESTYRVLRANGLMPGRDVAVTGFDNSATSEMLEPPLASVQQDRRQIAETVVEMAQCFLRGETPSSVRLPTRLVIRPSCGCAAPKETAGSSEKAAVSWQQEDRMHIRQLMHNNILTSLMLRNLLTDDISTYSFFLKIGNLMWALKTSRSWIGLLENPLTTDGTRKMYLPDKLRLMMVQDGENTAAYSMMEAPLLTAGGENEVLRPDGSSGWPCAVYPLFYGSVHYGFFMAEIDPADAMFYYTLSLEIGNGLRYLFLALDKKKILDALEEKNTFLDFTAIHDTLTGLLNRSGAKRKFQEYLDQYGRGNRFIMAMADLDHLKQINDTFGHSEGDHALITATRLLQSILPAGSPLARTGGDEFLTVFLKKEDYTAEQFTAGVHEACAAFNAKNALPYYVELSLGCYEFDFEQGAELSDIISRTDLQLYENKKLRRKSSLRGSKS